MSSTSETDTEILLGNRHLLAIFFVLAILLGIAFTGGYMVGRNSPEKKSTTLAAGVADPAPSTASSAPSSLETHQIPPAGTDTAPAEQPPAKPAEETAATPQPEARVAQPPAPKEDAALGTPKRQQTDRQNPPISAPKTEQATRAAETFAGPQGGQTFLQVAAVGHTEASALADVLSKKGFRAHAVPKPGTEIYRVLIGPLRDAGDLSTTRDSLRNAGFTKIFVQRY